MVIGHTSNTTSQIYYARFEFRARINRIRIRCLSQELPRDIYYPRFIFQARRRRRVDLVGRWARERKTKHGQRKVVYGSLWGMNHDTYIHTHTYIHTYSYIHTYIHTYIDTLGTGENIPLPLHPSYSTGWFLLLWPKIMAMDPTHKEGLKPEFWGSMLFLWSLPSSVSASSNREER